MPRTGVQLTGNLENLPSIPLAGMELYRVYCPVPPNARRTDRKRGPFWFSSVPIHTERAAREDYGRFDLTSPYGTCYFGQTLIAAVLEVFTGFKHATISERDLTIRNGIKLVCPGNAPDAIDLNHPTMRGRGVTGAMSAGGPRYKTQQLADQLHSGKWRALSYKISNDPALNEKALAVFDAGGEHPPLELGKLPDLTTIVLHGNAGLYTALEVFGIRVGVANPSLPIVTLADSGLI